MFHAFTHLVNRSRPRQDTDWLASNSDFPLMKHTYIPVMFSYSRWRKLWHRPPTPGVPPVDPPPTGAPILPRVGARLEDGAFITIHSQTGALGAVLGTLIGRFPQCDVCAVIYVKTKWRHIPRGKKGMCKRLDWCGAISSIIDHLIDLINKHFLVLLFPEFFLQNPWRRINLMLVYWKNLESEIAFWCQILHYSIKFYHGQQQMAWHQ